MKKLIVLSFLTLFSVGSFAEMEIPSKKQVNPGVKIYSYLYSGKVYSFKNQVALDQSLVRLRASKNFEESKLQMLSVEPMQVNRSE